MKQIVLSGVFCMLLVVAASSCGRFGNDGDTKAIPIVEPVASESDSEADREAALREAVRRYVEAEGQRSNAAKGQVVQKKPYFFKAYSVYPDGGEIQNIAFHESDSRTTPYSANVQVNKQRFATAYSRKKDSARDDNNYIRSTGVETLTFDYHYGSWRRSGGLFLADRVEENVNGEWVPIEEEAVQAAAAAEDDGSGWFSRALSSITGR